jgi:hypothetical protein
MAGPILVDGVPMRSIRQINALPEEQKVDVYQRLIPDDLLAQFGIDPIAWTNAEGVKLVHLEATPGSGFLRIRVLPFPDFPDPLFQFELGDTGNHQLEVLLVIINDPSGERFNVDRDWADEPTKFGLMRRNLQEEERAMKAGLAPGQVRRGLHQMRRQQKLVENFAAALGHEIYLANPLGYHNAIFLEWQGFNYISTARNGAYGTRPQLGHPRWNSGRALARAGSENVQAAVPSRWRVYFPGRRVLSVSSLCWITTGFVGGVYAPTYSHQSTRGTPGRRAPLAE